jgi:hydrogenase maturation protease
MSDGKVLIAGVGNIFLGDDAFGVEVARRMALRPLTGGVRVIDFGIRGLDLTFALLEDYEAVILVDAVARGAPPGTLYVLEPRLEGSGALEGQLGLVEPHALDPEKVLRLARSLGGKVERVLLVGCEPSPSDPMDDDLQMEMSAPVRGAVEEAIRLIDSLVGQIRAGGAVAESGPLEDVSGARSCTNSPSL